MIIKRLPKDQQQRADKMTEIGNIAVKRAQEENRRAGIINYYSGDDGSIYCELPSAEYPRPNLMPDGEFE